MTQLRDLSRPFPQRLIKENPSGYGDYVPHGIYKQRLLHDLGPYSFQRVEILRGRVKGHDDLGEVVVGVVMRLTVKIDGERVSIEEVGDCERPDNWPHDGARLKDAVSDALKRCSPHIGLGLHLYNPDAYMLFEALTREEQDAEQEEPDDDPGRPFTEDE